MELPESINRIAVIGGGIAGLITAALLKRANFEVHIYERNQNIGGVWEKGYKSLKIQSPPNLYEIPFFIPTIPLSKYPDAKEIQGYLIEFAENFDLKDSIYCEHDVIGITEGPKRIVKINHHGQIKSENFDFVVISTGYFSDPHIPTLDGFEKFKGVVTHTSKFYNIDEVKGKNVVVVGLGKSSLDCLCNIQGISSKSTFIYRSLFWPIPVELKFPGKTYTIDQFISNRFMLTLKNGNAIREEEPLERFANYSQFGKNLIQGIFSGIEDSTDQLFRLTELGMRPPQKLQDDIYATFAGPLELYEAFHNKSIDYFQDEVVGLNENCVITKSGKKVQCDYIIFGTGFKSKFQYLSEKDRNLLYKFDPNIFYLFNSMISPDIKNIAFIGYYNTLSNPLADSLCALWLVKFLKGEISVDEEQMRSTINEKMEYVVNFHKEKNIRMKMNYFSDMKFYDSLLKQMNENPKRKGGKGLKEYFGSYTPKDYSEIFKNYI